MYRRKKRTRIAPKARSRADKCATKWCRNERASRITRYISKTGKVIEYQGSLKLCWKCQSRQLKARHPATYVLNAIRNRARQRKVPFTITLAQFKAWCVTTGYLEKRGQEPDCATIDRINHDEGYHIWNIELRSHAENSANGHTVPGRETEQNESQTDYPERGPDYLPENGEIDESEPVGVATVDDDEPGIDSNSPF